MKLQAKNMTGSIVFAGILLLGLINIAGSGAQTVSTQATPSTQKTFSTPEQAGQALRAAAGANDESAMAQILGPDSNAVLSSGDAVEDHAALAEFAAKYDRMNRWVTMTDGSRVLYIGADNYPYPIPLAQNASAQWYFNTDAGKDEILARRIGGNELLAIGATYALADAEEAYFLNTDQYTDKIFSTQGKQDGLFSQASAANRLIFGGYSFRIITGKSGYTIVASPVTYGDSGIMTFTLNKGGEVYQKDLGLNTASVPRYVNDGWTPAE